MVSVGVECRGQLLAGLDRYPAGHDCRDVRVPRPVEVENPPVRVDVFQEVRPFTFRQFGVRLGILQPSPPGFFQVIAQHPSRSLGHRCKGVLAQEQMPARVAS